MPCIGRVAALRPAAKRAAVAGAVAAPWGTDRPTLLPMQALGHAMAAAVVEGVRRLRTEGLATTAWLSLARTAALLLAEPAAPEGGLTTEPEVNLAPAIVATVSEPARRLCPVLDIAGVPVRRDLPARASGSAPAEWGRPE